MQWRYNIAPTGNRTRMLQSFSRRHLVRISATVTGFCLNFTHIIHAKFYPDYPYQILSRLSVPNFAEIISAKFYKDYTRQIYPDYPCQFLPRLSVPNFTQIIRDKICPAHPCQNLPRMSMPNLTQIIHAKFYSDYPCRILPRLSMPKFTRDYQCQILPRISIPNSKYRIVISPDICYSVHSAKLSVVSLDALLCSLCSRLWPAVPIHDPLKNRSGVTDSCKENEILDLHSATAPRSVEGAKLCSLQSLAYAS